MEDPASFTSAKLEGPIDASNEEFVQGTKLEV
jgi:hypothetical protein